jgi:hypothetical protein
MSSCLYTLACSSSLVGYMFWMANCNLFEPVYHTFWSTQILLVPCVRNNVQFGLSERALHCSLKTRLHLLSTYVSAYKITNKRAHIAPNIGVVDTAFSFCTFSVHIKSLTNEHSLHQISGTVDTTSSFSKLWHHLSDQLLFLLAVCNLSWTFVFLEML